MDVESQRISLGLKKSYLSPSDGIATNVSNHETQLSLSSDTNSQDVEVFPFEFEVSEPPAFTEVESRAFVPALEVTLEDTELPNENVMAIANGSNAEDTNLTIVKDKKGSKKKAKEERFGFFTLLYCTLE